VFSFAGKMLCEDYTVQFLENTGIKKSRKIKLWGKGVSIRERQLNTNFLLSEKNAFRNIFV
jgi:hypothetical protein